MKKRLLAVLALGAIGAVVFAISARSQDPGSDPNAEVDVPEQYAVTSVTVDHELTRGEAARLADVIVEGNVADFAVEPIRESLPASQADSLIGESVTIANNQHALWTIQVTKAQKGSPAAELKITSQSFKEIVANDNRNPYLEGSTHRFYLVRSGLGGEFYVLSLAEPVTQPVATPDAGPVVFDDEGDQE